MSDQIAQSAVQRDVEKEIAAEVGWSWCDTCGWWEAPNHLGGREIFNALVSARLRLREVEQERDKAHALAIQSHSEWLLFMDEQTIKDGKVAESYVKWWNATERAESAESRLAQAGKLAEAARLFAETDPFSYTINGDDTCQWCRRDRPSVDGPWSDEVWWSEDFHNSDCEGMRVATEANKSLLDFSSLESAPKETP